MRVMGLTSPLPDFLVDTPWESLPGKASLESSPWKALPGKLSLERNLLGPGHPVTQAYLESLA